MNFGWDTDEEKLLRYIKISPKMKLEWLQEMHSFLLTIATPKRRKMFWKLRGIK